MRTRPHLLLLGASGGVARALLRQLSGQRARFGRVILLDRNTRIAEDTTFDLNGLGLEFVQSDIDPIARAEDYRRLLRRHSIGVVVDLTGEDTLPQLAMCDAAGVSYVSTALAGRGVPLANLVNPLLRSPDCYARAPHLLGMGMNPGAVNAWVLHAVRAFGRPREIVHFEHDTSSPLGPWRPFITWSRRDFLEEIALNPTGFMGPEGLQEILPNALAKRIDIRPLLHPIRATDRAVYALVVLHDENLTLAQRVGTSSKFLYAFDPRTRRHLARVWRKLGTVRIADLELGDNVRMPLEGGDLVGVRLDYGRRVVYYFNEVQNASIVGTNATCAQVAVGLLAALLALLSDPLPRRVFFPDDLMDSSFPRLVFDNLRVERRVFARRRRRLIPAEAPEVVRIPARDGGPRLLF